MIRRLTALYRRLRKVWACSCLRAHIAQLEMGLGRADLWAADDPVVGAMYAAQLAALRVQLAVLERAP